MADGDIEHPVRDPLIGHYQAEIVRLSREVEDLHDMLDHQAEMICRFLPDTTLLYVNQAYASYFSRTPAQMVGTRFIAYVPEDRRAEGMAYLKSFTPDRPVQEKEHEAILPDGTVRWTWWRDRALFDESGRVVAFQSVGRDMTRERLTAIALRDAEQRLETLERRAAGDRACPVALLSRRERQVAALIAEGKTNKQIAYALDLQVASVKVYATSIFRKLDVRNRTQATVLLLSQTS